MTLFCSDFFGQSDTSWHKSVTARYSYDLITTTAKPFSIRTIECQLKKGDHTFVPMIAQKSIHDLLGYQFGGAYYKKWDWGYSHVDAFYSRSNVFPSFVLRSNLFLTIKKGVEANLGFSRISYADGSRLPLLNLGATVYHKSMMATYRLKIPISGLLFHQALIRKHLKSEKDYLQLSISNGQEQEELLSSTMQTLNIYSFQFSLHKTIINKTQIQLSFGLSQASNESTANQFFNYSLGLKREI